MMNNIRLILDRYHEATIIELHNVWTIYGQKPSGVDELHPKIKKARPRDWGNEARWHYERFQFGCMKKVPIGVTLQITHYINHVHCWTDLRPNSDARDELDFYADLFAWKICKIVVPGDNPALCGRDYLDRDDVWDSKWGDRPPYFVET